MIRRLIISAFILAWTAMPAMAHLDPAEHGSFAAGFTHPLFGLDHVLAMVTVGLWAALLGGRAVWIVPVAFVIAMAVGFAFAIAGLPVPLVEPVILASVVAFGLLVAIAAPIPIGLSATIVGLFAFFHGHAHGSELGMATAISYGAGFVVATAILHACGIALGLSVRSMFVRQGSDAIIRAAGAAVALSGLALAFAG